MEKVEATTIKIMTAIIGSVMNSWACSIAQGLNISNTKAVIPTMGVFVILAIESPAKTAPSRISASRNSLYGIPIWVVPQANNPSPGRCVGNVLKGSA